MASIEAMVMVDDGTVVPKSMVMRWIPVTERLPENDVDVLICINNGDVFVARRYTIHSYSGTYSGWNDAVKWWAPDDEDLVKAWMPLPEPYRPIEEDVW